jgi:hypothetical protein
MDAAEERLAEDYAREGPEGPRSILDEIGRRSRTGLEEALEQMKDAAGHRPRGKTAGEQNRTNPAERRAGLGAFLLLAVVMTAVTAAAYCDAFHNGALPSAWAAIRDNREEIVREVIEEVVRARGIPDAEAGSYLEGARKARMEVGACLEPEQEDQEPHPLLTYQVCESTLWLMEPSRMRLDFTHVVEMERKANPFRKHRVLDVRHDPDRLRVKEYPAPMTGETEEQPWGNRARWKSREGEKNQNGQREGNPAQRGRP